MNKIYDKLIKKYGIDNQLGILQEELAELIVAVSHYKRNRKSNIPEEIADVEIMLEQIIQHYDMRNDIDEWKTKKLERMDRRLKKKPDH